MPTVIHTYTRAQAIEDGVSIDVSEVACEVGFRWPVAVTSTKLSAGTAGVWAYVEPTPELEAQGQSPAGRLWACSERSRMGYPLDGCHFDEAQCRPCSTTGFNWNHPGDVRGGLHPETGQRSRDRAKVQRPCRSKWWPD